MKTMQKGVVVKRVQDGNAKMMEKQGFTFVSKKVWKEQKATGKKIQVEDAPEQMKKTKKGKRTKKVQPADGTVTL